MYSCILDKIKEIYDLDREEEGKELYARFFDVKTGNVKSSLKYELKNWVDELLDLWEVPNNFFRKSYTLDLLKDDTSQRLILEHIYYYCQNDEAEAPCDVYWLQEKDSRKYSWEIVTIDGQSFWERDGGGDGGDEKKLFLKL